MRDMTDLYKIPKGKDTIQINFLPCLIISEIIFRITKDEEQIMT